MSMRLPPKSNRGLCLLSFDAGGERGISQLKILAALMHALGFDDKNSDMGRPCTTFDMIGGVGSGGFIAILLVIFKLKAQQALLEFINLSQKVLNITGVDNRERTSALESYINALMVKYQVESSMSILPQSKPPEGCKLIVPVSYKQHVGSHCMIRNFEARQGPGLDFTVREAILATLADPLLFLPTPVFQDSSVYEYISGDSTLSNPIREIISEACETFGPEKPIACVLSLGCGHPGFISIPENSVSTTWDEFYQKIATNSEGAARLVESQMGHLGVYHRFSVARGLEYVSENHELTPQAILTLVMAYLMWLCYQILGNSSPEETTFRGNIPRILSHTAVYLEEIRFLEKTEACLNSIKTRGGVTLLEQLTRAGGGNILPPLSRARPRLTQSFIMRVEPFSFLERAIFGPGASGMAPGQNIIAITGGAGYGKTQIVLKFIQEYKEKFLSIFVVNGSSRPHMTDDIKQNVRSLGAEHSQKQFKDCLVYLAQPTPSPRLIVYDNADDPKLTLKPFLPGGESCVIIITSRNHAVGNICRKNHLRLDVMSPEEAVHLLESGLHPTIPKADSVRQKLLLIAQELGHHPIALSQACGYMYTTPCSPGEYLIRLQQSRKEILERSSPLQDVTDHVSAFAAFDASFAIVPARDRKCLQLLSCLYWDKFPLELISMAAEREFTSHDYKCTEPGDAMEEDTAILTDIFHQNGQWAVTNLDDITLSLQNYSLVALVFAGDTRLLQMHPLFHEWVHSSIEGNKDKYRSAAARLLALGARKTPNPSTPYLATHVKHLLSCWTPSDLNDCWSFGYILSDADEHDGALKMRQKVVQELRKHLDSHDAALLNSLQVLADTYTRLQRFTEANQLQEEVLNRQTEVSVERNENTFVSYNSLAATYRSLGRFEDAEAKQVEVLAWRKKELGEQHPDTLLAYSDLARTYHDLGRLEEAEAIQVDVLARRTNLFGEQHPDSLLASSNLALTYHDLGQLEKAAVVQSQVLELTAETLGMNHPSTILASSSLARTYYDLGRLKEAGELQARILDSTREVLGEGHPDTLSAYRALGSTYCAMKRFSDAEDLQREALKMTRKIFGESHAATISAMHNLAQVQIEASNSTRQTLGEQHPDTILASSNVTNTYRDMEKSSELARKSRDMGKLDEAAGLQVELIEAFTEVFGEGHQNTLSEYRELGLTYCAMGRFSEAEALLLRTMTTVKKRFGPHHPTTAFSMQSLELVQVKAWESKERILGESDADTILASSNLARTYRDMGRLEEAEALQRGLLTLSSEDLRNYHPDIFLAYAELGFTYCAMERFSEAETLLVDKLKLTIETFGVHHPAAISARHNMESIQIKALETRKRVLGEEHPDTIIASSNLACYYRDMGRLDEAEALQLELLKSLRERLWNGHPNLYSAYCDLGMTYCAMGKFLDAENLAAEGMSWSKEIFGESHPATISAMRSLLPIRLKALESRKSTFGETHEDTILASSNLASIYRILEQFDKTEARKVGVSKTYLADG